MDNLGNLFKVNVGTGRIAAIDLLDMNNPKEVTYGDLDRRCDAVARGLVAQGLGPGDRIAILSQNRIEFMEVLFGALRAGCVPVPINIKLPGDTVEFIIRDAGVKHLFYDLSWEARPAANLPGTDFDDDYPAFLDRGDFDAVPVAEDQVSMQLYTAGTTGRPKGVLLTHGGQDWASRALVEARRLTFDDRILISAPFFHKNALVAIKTAMLPGASLVIMPRFQTRAAIQAISGQKCTMVTGVPTMMYMMLAERDLIESSDFSSVRTISMGSAPASDVLLGEISAVFKNAAIQLNYGTTEGGPIMLGWFHPDGLPRPVGSVGYPIPGCEYRFEGGPNENEGELVLRNPGVALGFYNYPKETARCFKDGWNYSGDIMRQDEDGWFYFVGRVDDMFVCGGENIFPGEVESMLEKSADVSQAVVLPFSHDTKGEVPYAFVVPERGAALAEEDVKSFALENGPAYAHPRRVFILSEIPLTGTNKTDREALRALAGKEA
ncbi:MAG: class I adenylate-forming enzyme family protein [Rhodospirillales bacterium]|jgi:acyl-CoA synthetase (AMP-forming)/AMP-acid ligase II|nr:class I adenylate-forming enzyme family protein [Rhodospirillales bacterium]MDP6643868.1 class I adenylate-forming enzyme family protein [Rhodospirillales bacterium]MDP6842201.1 class I adenylate-forming enzyme family protein [Rhodospirillales bacterium]|tara:strand:- start:1011 stop:2489 length:1479 start_codon:yes stop_codon:yes gene_type:complete